ncbi:hypothetical protein FRC01_006535, partial [Tulasnella sp. 417]
NKTPSAAIATTENAKPAAAREFVAMAPLEAELVVEAEEAVAEAEEDTEGNEAASGKAVSPRTGCPAALQPSKNSKDK